MKNKFIIAGILVFAFILRFWGIDYDLPYILHPDEPTNFEVSRRMFAYGTLNPNFFAYPSLSFYANFLVIGPYYLYGKIFGFIHTTYDILSPDILAFGIAKTFQPNLILLSRLVSVIFGLGYVLFSYLITRRLYSNRFIQFYSALAIACCPTIVTLSQQIIPDVSATFFILGAFYFSVLIFQEGKNWHYIAAGLFVGFAASCKYNAALIGIVVPAAHLLRNGISGWKNINPYKAGLFSILGFLLTSPYTYIERKLFLYQLQSEAAHYANGHLGMEGNILHWYFNHLWENLYILFPFAIFQIFLGLVRRSKESILLCIFPILYFGFISSFIVRNDRTILPIIPFLLILASTFLNFLFEIISKYYRERKFIPILLGSISLIILLPTTFKTVENNILRGSPNPRIEAAEWIKSNVPVGSKIAMEHYSPYIDSKEYKLTIFDPIAKHSISWYLDQKFDFIIVSKLAYARYLAKPEKYPSHVRNYDDIFHSLNVIKTFSDERKEEIRIYKVVSK
ncbi:ArnT family glycosyltransferase [Leptospira licerasiae]|uniref:ArnT family glycosyltransferase n=1 Tax=Leptospira licerasiae TaxID=447106 RepID=UPI00108449A1|nr:glycosyltransferase family 39 protein [Leptospira licerasiae]TGM89992.1 phospholipid carrier-dependent glycosyltransferase [Leptospira licerasiae]